MVTWEDIGSESGSDKDDADESAKVAMGLVATMTSEVEPELDSEEENEHLQEKWYRDWIFRRET